MCNKESNMEKEKEEEDKYDAQRARATNGTSKDPDDSMCTKLHGIILQSQFIPRVTFSHLQSINHRQKLSLKSKFVAQRKSKVTFNKTPTCAKHTTHTC